MASGGGNKKKENESSGGNLLGFVGGAVLGAALAYGVKKAFDYFNEESNMESPQSSGSYQSSSSKMKCMDEDYEASSKSVKTFDENVYSHEEETSDREVNCSLQEFYESYVRIEDEELSAAREVVNQIMRAFNRHVNQNLATDLPIGPMYINNVEADLLVVKPDHFTIHVPIYLNPKMWNVISENSSCVLQQGYVMIKRNISQSFPLGYSPYDRHLLGECLSPVQLNLKLQEALEDVAWGTVFSVHAVMVNDHASIIVRYDGEKQIYIDFVPVISLDTQSFIAELHPKAKTDQSYHTMWVPSFLSEEQEKMGEIIQNEGFQRLCLLTFLALPNSAPTYFGFLKKDVLKTVFFHLVDCEDIWYEETLLERFIDMLKSLEEHLRVGKLPNYFNPYINVLEPYSQIAMDNLRAFISKTIGKNQFKWLLTRPK